MFRIRESFCFLTAALILACAGLLWLNPLGQDSGPGVSVPGVLDELIAFRRLAEAYHVNHPSYFPNSLEELVNKLSNDPDFGPELQGACPTVIANEDPWGNEFEFVIDRLNRRILIRSKGKNGIDENGKGDDVDEEITF